MSPHPPHPATTRRRGAIYHPSGFYPKNSPHCPLAIRASTSHPHSCPDPILSAPTHLSILARLAREKREGEKGETERERNGECVRQRAGGGGSRVGGGEVDHGEQLQLAGAEEGGPERPHRDKAEFRVFGASVASRTPPADLTPGARSPPSYASPPTAPARRRPPEAPG